MSVLLSSFYEPIRFLILDTDPDVPTVQNCTIDSAIRFVVNSGAIHGYAIGSDNQSIIPYQSSSTCWQGYGPGYWDNYAYTYGYGSYSFRYGNYYNLWFDQGFDFLMNFHPAPCPQDSQDLTPTANQEGWKRLVAEVALWFVSGMTDQSFGTRSTRDRIAQPKDLLYKLELYVHNMKNRGVSFRPAPLPVVATGIRSFFSGLWVGYGGAGFGYQSWGMDMGAY